MDYICNSGTLEAEGESEVWSEAILGYVASSRSVWATLRDLISKTKQINKQNSKFKTQVLNHISHFSNVPQTHKANSYNIG